jgi:hypothetical protein
MSAHTPESWHVGFLDDTEGPDEERLTPKAHNLKVKLATRS